MIDRPNQSISRQVSRVELAKLNSTLGHELVAGLLEISAASLQRYQNGDRQVPDAVAERPRSAFNGQTARQMLGHGWVPGDEPASRVLAAAESLQELGAT